jgi:hypothetical protein
VDAPPTLNYRSSDLDTVLVSCGHICCGNCAKKLKSEKLNCSIYRAEISSYVKVYARLISLDE